MSLVHKKAEILDSKKQIEEGKRDLIMAIFGREGSEWFVKLTTKNQQKALARLDECLLVLLPKERKVIDLNFGLEGEKRLSLTEIRQRTPYTRDRFLIIKMEAILKLRTICSAYISTGEGFERVIQNVPVQNLRNATDGKLTKYELDQLGVEELRLTSLAYNTLKRAGIHTLSDLIEIYVNGREKALRGIKRVGIYCQTDISSKLTEYIKLHQIDLECYKTSKATK